MIRSSWSIRSGVVRQLPLGTGTYRRRPELRAWHIGVVLAIVLVGDAVIAAVTW